MALADLRAMARRPAPTPEPVTRNPAPEAVTPVTPSDSARGYRGEGQKTEENRQLTEAVTRVTRVTPNFDDVWADKRDDLATEIANGYRKAALKRPPSWSDPAVLPSPGCCCSCCDGQRWWTEAHGRGGWCCWTCHPGDHLRAEQRREVRTG
jgi:hypothetical protein